MGKTDKGEILLVEDDPSTFKAISKIIKSYGYKVAEASGGFQAKVLLNENPDRFQAIVSDLVMPNVSGGDLAHFNKEHFGLPFVAISAFTDAYFGLKLLDLGVSHYCIKPVDRERFEETIENAINTVKLGDTVEDDTNPYAGNIGKLVVPSTMASLERLNRWVIGKTKDVVPKEERPQFLNFFGEFLLNAHEHGNLGIGENLKSRLLEGENFDMELTVRETNSRARLFVAVCALKGQVALSITDEGKGFDYEKYLAMTEDELVEKIHQLNGRGIFMGSRYFDTVEYQKDGRKVILSKNLKAP